MVPLAIPVQVALAVLVLTAAAYDIKFRRIPNWLNVAGVITGLALNTALNGWKGLQFAAVGLAVAFGLNLFFYLIHALGAGDVKLFAATGALAGLANFWYIFIFTALAGGLLALVLVVAKRRVKRTFWNVTFIIGELMRFRAPYLTREDLDVKSEKAMRLPRAVSIAVGTLVLLVCLHAS